MLLSFLYNVEILWNSYQHRFIVELFPGKVLFFFLKLGCSFECLNSCKCGGDNTSLQMKPTFDFMLNLKTLIHVLLVFAHSLNIEVPSDLCMPTQELEWGLQLTLSYLKRMSWYSYTSGIVTLSGYLCIGERVSVRLC